MIKENMEFVAQMDPEVGSAMMDEYNRQRRNIELIASENFVSPAVMAGDGDAVLPINMLRAIPASVTTAGASVLTWSRISPASAHASCLAPTMPMFSRIRGASANNAVYFALVKPGDTVMGMNLAHGGHLTHGSPVNISGSYYNIVPYSLR